MQLKGGVEKKKIDSCFYLEADFERLTDWTAAKDVFLEYCEEKAGHPSSVCAPLAEEAFGSSTDSTARYGHPWTSEFSPDEDFCSELEALVEADRSFHSAKTGHNAALLNDRVQSAKSRSKMVKGEATLDSTMQTKEPALCKCPKKDGSEETDDSYSYSYSVHGGDDN